VHPEPKNVLPAREKINSLRSNSIFSFPTALQHFINGS
jgi:hypothetical protein